MDIFIILLLGGAIAFLWSRMGQLERRISNLSERLDDAKSVYRLPGVGENEAPSLSPAAPLSIPATALPNAVAHEDAKFEAGASDAAASPPSEPVGADQPAEGTMAYQNVDRETLRERVIRGFAFDFEDIFGRRLPIWGGGFALAIAGIFLVRFSIEAGLLTPSVRVGMSFLFGLALLAGAEAAFRLEHLLRDPRVRQSLAGAGLATLYGAFYLAGTAYGLIGAGAAFVGLAIVTAVAIALSFRFGLPSAIIGLVGGFAAPLLVDSDSANVPLLSFYLALITGGLAWSGQVQGRNWLGYAALAAGLGWGALMMFAGVSSSSDFAALGIYLIILGSVLPALLHTDEGPSLPKLAAGAIATLQMAVLVSDAGFAPLTWGLYLLIGAALSGLGWRYPALRLGALIAAGLGLWLLLIWPDPGAQSFLVIAVVLTLIFAGVPLALQAAGRAKLLDTSQLSAVSLVMGIIIYVQYGAFEDVPNEPMLAASLAALAIFPAAGFALIWQRGEQGETRRVLPLITAAWLLLFGALLLLTPAWLAPVMAVAVSAPLFWCYWKREALALLIGAWMSAASVVIALSVTPRFVSEISQLGDTPDLTNLAQASLRWGAAVLPFACLAIAGRNKLTLSAAEAITVALVYGTIAQVMPSASLAWIAAAGAIALCVLQPARIAGWATALGISGIWAFEPFGSWAVAGVFALFGDPFLKSSAISVTDLALKILPLGAALGMAVWNWRDRRSSMITPIVIVLSIIATAALHSLYKQIFGINSPLAFEIYGMAERTIWQALLLFAAYAAWKIQVKNLPRPLSVVFIAFSFTHFVWFTLVLHNPLFSLQYVGPTPIANWLTPGYFIAISAVWFALAQWKDTFGFIPAILRRSADAVSMGLISLLAVSLLRQMFAGTTLTSQPVGQAESLLISLLGIVLALGFLWWGSSQGQRSWRIGSLLLMLAAVIKVFLIDAAALDGLLRIASFMALGFSLIGIGWVYSRQLSLRTASEESGSGHSLT